MKNLKIIIPLLFFCIISFTLVAKNKNSESKESIEIAIHDQELEDELIAAQKASFDENSKDSLDPLLSKTQEESFIAMEKHMYDFQKSKKENAVGQSGPSQEVKELSKKLDQCQYPNENAKVIRKVRGIKSFITLFKFKINI